MTLAQKLLAVQRKIGAVIKSSSNPHFRSKYADLNEVLDVAKEALNPEGIFIAQSPGADHCGKYVETSLINAEDGQQITARVYFSGSEENMQKIGAAITYARRFGLVSVLALEQEDDDGNEASGRAGLPAERDRPTGEARGTAKAADKPTAITNAPVQNAPVQGKVPAATPKKAILEKISLTSKVIIDSKRASQDDVMKMLTAYGVKTKEELTTEQAAKLLTQLEERLK